jgi:ubiquinone/menaquinone biosynthesis C-methylase UbiE
MLDASDDEHSRLIAIARRNGDIVRELCAAGGIGEGARVADVGCGPIGALLDLADVVGPQGTVLGIDSSEGAVESARAIVTREDLRHVRVVHADINHLERDALLGGDHLDAAFLRLVLVHQADPANMLHQVAALLRHGGRILVHDMVEDPRYPRYDPPVPASERVWQLLHAAAHARGVAVGTVARLPSLCEEAGFRVLTARGFFRTQRPAAEILASTSLALQSARRSIVGTGLATETEIDQLTESLASAAQQNFRSVLGPLMMLCIAEVP